jgi:tetrahydromethanopterin S-methyltransferase subunit B
MSLSTPTTQAISDNIVSQLESALSQSTPLLPRAFNRVLAKVLGAVFVILWKYAGWIQLQMFVQHASIQETVINGRVIRPLVEWGRTVGVGDPYAATRAEHTVEVTVLSQTGTLPANTQLLYAPTGVLYLTTAAVELNASTVTVTVRASSDQQGGGGAGSIGNLEDGAILQFANAPANVATNAVVSGQTVAGADAESAEAYRARVLRRFQRKPQGGAYADYQLWGSASAGVANIYPYTSPTPGYVDIYVEATEDVDPDGIAPSGLLNTVRGLIEGTEDGLATVRPACAKTNVVSISRVAFDVIVTGLNAMDIAGAQSLIEDTLDDYFRSREPFIVGLSTFPRRSVVTLAAVAGAVTDAADAFGGTVASVSLELSGSPLSAYTLEDGQKAKLGNLTFS